MDNKPNQGRGKKIIGKTESFHKTGDGLNQSKPLGKDVSYSKRPQSSSTGHSGSRAATRGLGGSSLIMILLLFFALRSCGGNGNMLGEGLSLLSGATSQSASSSSGLDLISVLGGQIGRAHV